MIERTNQEWLAALRISGRAPEAHTGRPGRPVLVYNTINDNRMSAISTTFRKVKNSARVEPGKEKTHD
jgi:hypothetical protein